MNSRPFIDAHHHLWDLGACHYPWLMAKGEHRFFGDPSAIQQNYLVDDFLAESPNFRPVSSVHIQVGTAATDSLKETQWLQQQSIFPQAVVAFTDLSADDVEEQVNAHLASSKVRGFRQIVGRHAREDLKHGSNALLTSREWLRGLRLLEKQKLSFDLQMIPPQMPEVIKVLKQVPDLRVALCHCGSPWDQSPTGMESWKNGLEQLAKLPNVFCKVSGLGMFNPLWRPQDLQPIVLDTIDIFGTQRVMFGSNFPVDKLYRSYDQLWSAYTEITQGFTKQEQEQLFLHNAANFYSIAI